jgi:hypothetical protein
MSSSKGNKSTENSTTNTTTISNDKRIVADANATVLSLEEASGAVFNITQDATNGEGFGRLLDLAENLFVGGGAIIQNLADSSKDSIEKINTAANDREGQIDQKTIVILAVAGVAAVYFTKGKK